MNGITYHRVKSHEPALKACPAYPARTFTYLYLPAPERYLVLHAAHGRRHPRIHGNLVGRVQRAAYAGRRQAARLGAPGALSAPYLLIVRRGFMTNSIL